MNQQETMQPYAGALVSNKYKVIVGMIKRMYPNNYEKIPKEIWEKLVFEIVNAITNNSVIVKIFFIVFVF